MAAKDKNQAQEPPAPEVEMLPAFDDSVLDGLSNIAARLPLYDGGDARFQAVGTAGYPVHGYWLGTVDLPSLIKEKDGSSKPWVGIVVELKQACPVKEGTASAPKKRIAKPGERIIVTETKVLQQYSRLADHPDFVYETVIKPEVAQVKSDPTKRYWALKTVAVGRRIQRDPMKHLVGLSDLLPELEAPASNAGALPERATA